MRYIYIYIYIYIYREREREGELNTRLINPKRDWRRLCECK